jgi:drug/metabolite transporter superfamily protein YnfA
VLLFGLAALAEIGGAWLVWQGVGEQVPADLGEWRC